MPKWWRLENDGVDISVADYGGSGSPVLLLHGLAGHAEEWSETTAEWLTENHRVVALDVRGHGGSERRPDDVSIDALVGDVVAALTQLGAPVVLVGQSLSGVTAIVTAARFPDLVRALVVVEASPQGLGPQQAAQHAQNVAEELRSWPAPFESRPAALAFFGGGTQAAAAWVAGLEETQTGLRARFDIDVLERMLRDIDSRDWWDEWKQIRCPTLVLRGENGSLREEAANRMAERLSYAEVVTVAGAGHDIHLDRPDAWQQTLTQFIGALS